MRDVAAQHHSEQGDCQSKWKNHLYYGDNLAVLRSKIANESVDLCYIDPPFNSKRNYFQIYNNQGSEDRAQAQAFVDTWEWGDEARNGLEWINDIAQLNNGRLTEQTVELIKGFERVLKHGSLLAYLVHMTLRIAEIHRVLKSTGSFYLHCDPTASHYLKLICDSVFVAERRGGHFRNEIIWHYLKWSVAQRQFVSNHDVIFFYTKTDSKARVFNTLFVERSPATKKRFGNARIISSHSDDGSRLPSQVSGDSDGVAMDDVWDISRVPPIKQLYPTEKPEILLERIIRASSNPGDTVLDAYCGCGTTVAVAQELGRRWIGIDITYQSISLILRRLEGKYQNNWPAIESSIFMDGVPRDIASAKALAARKDDKTRKEFEKWAVLTYSSNQARINDKKGADAGIDGTAFFLKDKGENGKAIFQVKSGGANRATVATLNSDRIREKAEFGILITMDPPSRSMRTEVSAAGTYRHPLLNREDDRIMIVTVQEILDGKRLDLPMSRQDTVKSAAAIDDQIPLF